MRVAVISDTHLRRYTDLPQGVQADLESADAVIHAGDFGATAFYEELDLRVRKLYGVLGNNDSLNLPRDLVIRLEGLTVAVTHGDGGFYDKENWLMRRFLSSSPKLIIFGHTHRYHYTEGMPALLNPGSAIRARDGQNSYVLLDICESRFSVVKISL